LTLSKRRKTKINICFGTLKEQKIDAKPKLLYRLLAHPVQGD